MERKAKIIVFLVATAVWAFVMVYLVVTTSQPPEPPLWGIPGGIWLTLNPPLARRKDADVETEAK